MTLCRWHDAPTSGLGSRFCTAVKRTSQSISRVYTAADLGCSKSIARCCHAGCVWCLDCTAHVRCDSFCTLRMIFSECCFWGECRPIPLHGVEEASGNFRSISRGLEVVILRFLFMWTFWCAPCPSLDTESMSCTSLFYRFILYFCLLDVFSGTPG